MAERNYSGNPYQTPVQLRTNAPRKTEAQPRTRQQRTRQQSIDDDGENDDAWTMPKPHSSAVTYANSYPRKSALLDKNNPKKTKRMRERQLDRSTLSIIVSLLIIVMVGGWWLLTTVSMWWTNWQDDLHYGNPRTFQVDQFVGQGDSPTFPDHFIAVNISGRVVVVQLNLKHPELDHTYGITTTDPKNSVSLSLRPTGNTWAMYVIIGATTPYTVELVSNGKQFVSPNQSGSNAALTRSGDATMQEIEKEEQQLFAPADPQSQPLQSISIEGDEKDDDPDEIFLNAVAEIDTQPLVKAKRKRAETMLTIGDVLEIAFIVSVLLFGLLGSMYLAITYPRTLVILYAKEYSATITTTLDLPTRTLAPITLMREATSPTTGTGHQEAKTATGQVTFYNGLYTEQSVPAGTVLTGSDGEQILTDQTAPIPPNAPPEDGYVTIHAHALHSGERGNIAADDVSSALSSSLTVKNLAAFTGGRDARTFRAVATEDLTTLTSTLNTTLTQAFPTAFPLQPGEAAIPTYCTTKTAADHEIGAEAATLTVTVSSMCQGIAYSLHELTHKATAAFMLTQPGAKYHTSGSVQTTIQRTAPLTVTIHGQWAYTFSTDYKESLAEKIAGATPSQARKLLLQTSVIADASIPTTLPPDGSLIDFLVLVGS